MKYTRLTKEQFEELHNEFINFLATQSITGDEWKQIKQERPEVAEQELDVFSDLIWEGVLTNARYLEHISPQQLFLFDCDPEQMHLIGLKIVEASVDIRTKEGYRWLQQNVMSDSVEVFVSSKKYVGERNLELFKMIQQGAGITKGELYQWFEKIVKG